MTSPNDRIPKKAKPILDFRTCFKNESVLETLKSAESTRTTRSIVVNARHFDHGRFAWGEIDF
jgi:hypothetical protein